eukprot:Gb_19554 [translate_table: standard]
MATTDSSSKATKEWKKMKVQELRDELSRRGLNTGGLRPSLIERLEKSSNPPGNAAAEACGPELPEITPQVEEGPKFSSTNNGQLVAKDFVSGTIIDAEKLGDSNVSESVSIPAAPGTTVEKPSNDAKDNGVANVAGPVSDLEKKHRRAERFGLALQLSEEEKRQSRAARYVPLNLGNENILTVRCGQEMLNTIKHPIRLVPHEGLGRYLLCNYDQIQRFEALFLEASRERFWGELAGIVVLEITGAYS